MSCRIQGESVRKFVCLSICLSVRLFPQGLSQPLGGLSQPLGGLAQPRDVLIQYLGGLFQSLVSPSQPLGGLSQPKGGLSQPLEGLSQPLEGLDQPVLFAQSPTVAGLLDGGRTFGWTDVRTDSPLYSTGGRPLLVRCPKTSAKRHGELI